MILRLALAAAAATAIYAAILGSLDPADLALGAAVSVVLLVAVGQPGGDSGSPPPPLQRIVFFPVWAASVIASVVAGAWRVGRAIIAPRGSPGSAIVAIPIEPMSRRGVAIGALATTVSPGEIVTDVDWERGMMDVHVLDPAGVDPDAVRARFRRRYERYQRRVFP